MRWFTVERAANEYLEGQVGKKSIYRAIRDGKCRAARIGAGRNLLVCDEFITEWLKATAPEVRSS